MNKKSDFWEAILIFEHDLAPSIEWKIQVSNRLCKDAAEALSKMKVE